MKFKTIVVVCSTILAAAGEAATINWGSGGGRGNMFVASDGLSRIPAGSLVQVGFFAVPNDATSVFTLLGTTSLGDPGAAPNNIGGHLPSSGKQLVGTAANGNQTFAGKQFAIIVYNSASALTATQKGIFTAVAWTTPGGAGFDDSSDTVTFTVGSSTTALTGNGAPTALDPDGAAGPLLAASTRVGRITVGGTNNDVGEIYTLASIVAVPEPANLLLLGMSSFALLSRRRRK